MSFQRWVRVRSLPQHLTDPNPSNNQGERYALIAPLVLVVEDQQNKKRTSSGGMSALVRIARFEWATYAARLRITPTE